MGVKNYKRTNAIKGTMNHGINCFSTDIFAGAIISVAQYLAPLRYAFCHLKMVPNALESVLHCPSVLLVRRRSNLH
jgi:hypothetical protein